MMLLIFTMLLFRVNTGMMRWLLCFPMLVYVTVIHLMRPITLGILSI